MDHHQALDRAGADFLDLLRGVTDDQWEGATCCDDWTVRDLAQHVLGGSRMAVVLAEGGAREDAAAALDTPLDDDNPVTAVEAEFLAQAGALADPEVLARTLPHPAADLPGSQVLGFRIADLAVHSWDLAQATGQDDTLDPEVTQIVWDDLQPMLPMLGAVGVFGDGPSGTVPDDADTQTKVIDALGRRP